jgi:DNA mismatch endonuclease (patch repair protein)
MDVHPPKTRSFNMSQIRGKDTKPELLVRKFLFANGFRYRIHVKTLPGKPDIVLPKYKTVIFVNGCFWHGHEGCKYFVIPRTRTDWWMAKIEKTIQNDRSSINKLASKGWKVINVWECELKKDKREKTLHTLLTELNMPKR